MKVAIHGMNANFFEWHLARRLVSPFAIKCPEYSLGDPGYVKELSRIKNE
jgi:hypothetical protein